MRLASGLTAQSSHGSLRRYATQSLIVMVMLLFKGRPSTGTLAPSSDLVNVIPVKVTP